VAQNNFLQSPSAPNLFTPNSEIPIQNKLPNDTFNNELRVQNYLLDNSSSIFSLSQDQSSQSFQAQSNLKTLSKSIKVIQIARPSHDQIKPIKNNFNEKGKDFLKQNSLLSQLQELNSSQEEGKSEISGDKSYITKLGGSLIYDPTLQATNNKSTPPD